MNGTPRFSPNGKSLALGLRNEGLVGRRAGLAFSDQWEVDVASGEPTRLTSGAAGASPFWSANGEAVLFTGEVDGKGGLWSVPRGGGARPSSVLQLGIALRNASATPDGKAVLIATGQSSRVLLRGWLDGSGRVDTLVSMTADGIRADDPGVSPDGAGWRSSHVSCRPADPFHVRCTRGRKLDRRSAARLEGGSNRGQTPISG